MEQVRKAEQVIIRLRWLIMLAGALLLAPQIDTEKVILALAVAGACNTLLGRIADSAESFAKHGTKVSFTACLLDLSLITVGISCSGARGSHFYLLYFFPILATGFVWNSRSRLATMLILAVTGNTYALVGSAHGVYTSSWLSIWLFSTIALVFGGVGAHYLAINRKEQEDSSRRDQKMTAIVQCSTQFTTEADMDELLKQVIVAAVRETGAVKGAIMLFDPEEPDTLRVTKSSGLDPGTAAATAIPRGQGIAGWVADSGQALVVQPGDREAEVRDVWEGQEEQGAVCVPLVQRSERSGSVETSVIGVMWVAGSSVGFTSDDLELVKALANQAAVAIVNVRLYLELRQTFIRTMQSLARTLDARDPYTHGHSQRVAAISKLIAINMHVDDESVRILEDAALLHDIGKIGVPDAVLRKTDKLTDEEWLLMRAHPVIGEEICQPLGLSPDQLFLIRHHHERLHGGGYPDNLSADQQPLLLRIICAVDAFDAMSSNRPYRQALTIEARVEELNRAAGTTFDQAVVETLKELLKRGELKRFYQNDAQMDQIRYGSSPEPSRQRKVA